MALLSQPPINFSGSLSSGTASSDLLRSSRIGFCGFPPKPLEGEGMGMRRDNVIAHALMKRMRGKKRIWPRKPDPNLKGGILRHLSDFKPLKQEPIPFKLEFEDKMNRIEKRMKEFTERILYFAEKYDIDLTPHLVLLQYKFEKVCSILQVRMSSIQRVIIARHPQRPTCLDHIFNITDKFVELHGDRAGYDDPAIVTGIGTVDGRRFMFIGHQKGRNQKENIKRNFGMPTPHGYRKALRMMRYADHLGFPIVTFVDTPGAFADAKAERLNQGEAIAFNLMTMFGLKVPTVTIVLGEGGSGGALAIACTNKVHFLENAIFFVASPEAAAAILYRSAKRAPVAASRLKITSHPLCRLGVGDRIINEPFGGAHNDPEMMSRSIKEVILETMDELEKLNLDDLIAQRCAKFRAIGVPKPPFANMALKYCYNQKRKDKPTIEALENQIYHSSIRKLREHLVNENVKSVTHYEVKVVDALNHKMVQIIQDAIKSSPDLQYKRDLLRVESRRNHESPNEESREKIKELERDIKLGTFELLRSSAVTKKVERVNAELSRIVQYTDGTLLQELPEYKLALS